MTGSSSQPQSFAPEIPLAEILEFEEGLHRSPDAFLGPHPRVRDGVTGTRLAVWAPAARSVGVMSSVNDWNASTLPMERRSTTGVWELFIPGMKPGDLYKFQVESPSGARGEKADPFGRAMELRPHTASVVPDSNAYSWTDAAWLRERSNLRDRPMSIYEVHLGSWRTFPDAAGELRWGTYQQLAETLVPYVAEQGFTHLELLPITEHPLDQSWGYQTVGYYAPTSRYGDAKGLCALVDAAHAHGLGVILDWVPAHFPRDGHGLSYFDGTHLFEPDDPRRAEHPEWGTYIFDYGRPQVRSFLIGSALYWLREFHLDGIRVDAVASMLYLDYGREPGKWLLNEHGGRENLEAVEFLKELTSAVHAEFPTAVVCAEESTEWAGVTAPVSKGGLGFDFKWNMGWMHDMLDYMSVDPLLRKGNHKALTFSILYAWSEAFLLPLSHDEVVHGKSSLLGKMPGPAEQKFHHLRVLYAVMWSYPGKKLLFMGGEIGMWDEWSHGESLRWDLLQYDAHLQLQAWVRALNSIYRTEPALHARDHDWRGFQWIDFEDHDNGVVVFERRGGEGEAVLVILHFTPVFRTNYRIGTTRPGTHRRLLSSDEPRFGGDDQVADEFETEDVAWHGQSQSIEVSLPALGAIFLKLPEAPGVEGAD